MRMATKWSPTLNARTISNHQWTQPCVERRFAAPHPSMRSHSISYTVRYRRIQIMTFTNDQKTIVQTTFGMVSDADALAATFYARLFEIDPSTRHMFHGDMKQQRQK